MKLPCNYNELHYTERRKVREEYIRQQKGNCYYCGASLDGPPAEQTANKTVQPRLFPKNFFKWPIHLHHDHLTGMTVGAVHCHCNAVLWEYENT